jgi:PKD repeat protein
VEFIMRTDLLAATLRPARRSPTGERSRRTRGRGLALLAGILLTATILPTTEAATKVIAGYRDVQYGDPAAPGGDDVTVAANQSKLWFHDGNWFGVLFDPRSTPNAKFRIYRFTMATQDWTSTGVAVDDRNRSHADVLDDGANIWVASAHKTGSLRVYKFTYNAATKAYSIAAGFPVTIANTTTGTGYATIAKDTTGRLWVAYTMSNRVKVTSSTTGTTWDVPFDLPGMGNDLTAEDTAAITRISGSGVSGVGVMWDNQTATDDSFYFAAHVDGAAVGTWQARETAFGTPGSFTYSADNHISLKTDLDGNAIAAVKTGRDSDPAPNGGDPLVTVLRRTGSPAAAGSWTSHPVTDVSTDGTRPMLVIDDAADEADVFLTFPTLASSGDQAIYRRKAPLSTLNFGSSSLGTAVIDSATEVAINDPTSSKAPTTLASGILVEAADVPTLYYFHACIGGPCPAAPVANFTGTPTSGAAPLTVQFTDTSTGNPTSWSWNFGDGTTSTAQNPSHVYASAGTYDVSLTATNLAGSDSKTVADYITVSPPPEVAYFPLAPVRLLDTRSGNGLSGAFSVNVSRTWQIAGRGGVPANAVAVTGNLTVTGQTKAGFVSLGPIPTSNPTTSTLNFPVGDNRANGATVPLSGDGKLSAVYKASSSPATTHVLFDVTGYFLETSGGDTYHDLAPVRLLDTRFGNGLNGVFTMGTPRTVQITGRGGIPAGATAITANLTVTSQTKAGFVTLGPTPVSSPTTSSINFPVGDNRANGVTVPLSGGGAVSAVYISQTAGSTTHLILDVTGYFTHDSTGAHFVALTPVRLLDTRVGNGLSGVFTWNVPRTWTVGNRGGVDPDAVAIVGNVTVVNQTKSGFVSITPAPTVNPTTSTINFPLGDTRANNLTGQVGAAATLSATLKSTSASTTHLLFDATGYYQ